MSILAANELAVTSSASTAKTDNTRLICFISILLVKVDSGLPFHDLNSVPIRIADRDCFPESRLAVRQLYSSCGYESGPAVPESLRGFVHADPQESGLPVDQVIGLFLQRKGASVTRSQVFEKLDPWSRGRSKSGYVETGPENIVESFLFRTVVFTLSRDFHPEPVPIEFQTRLCFRNDDGSVIYSQKQLVGSDVPLRIALVGRKPEDLQRVTVHVAEIECADAAGIRVPGRQKLRS